MTKTTPFDVSDYLNSSELIAEYLNITIETGSPELLYKAIGNTAKAKTKHRQTMIHKITERPKA